MYRGLAGVYDRLSNVDHHQWADFLEYIFQTNGLSGDRILDLACGTGNMCKELAQRGYKPVGVDLSEEMLAVAESKLRGLGVSLYRADMRELPALGQFDAVVCLSDSFNYLVDHGELEQVLKSLCQIKPQLLIFDLNTPYYLSQVLADNSFQLVEDDVAYIWENTYLPEEGLCEMQITFFTKDIDDRYIRFDEFHVEKAFNFDTIQGLLEGTGWRLLAVYNGYSDSRPTDNTERWLFVAVPG